MLAEVTVDTADAEGVLFKQGAGHGGHVLFVQDGRLHYVYNFMGEDEQKVVAHRPDSAWAATSFGVRYDRTGTVEGSHTPLGDVSLFVDGSQSWRQAGVRAHPGTFGLAGGGVAVGRNTGQAVSSATGRRSLHRRHHREGGRRHLGYALPRRRTRTRAGVLKD